MRFLFRIAVSMSGMNVHAVALPGSISNFQCAPRDGNILQKESDGSGFADIPTINRLRKKSDSASP